MENLEVKILLVDDEEIILTLFKAALQSWGYNVEVASDGQQALQKCSENTFQILITDLNMPQMDGIEFTRSLRAHVWYRDLPVMMLTTQGEERERRSGMEAGVSAFLTKPITQRAFIQEVHRLTSSFSQSVPATIS